MTTEGLQAVTIEFLPMSMAEALHSLIFTGLLHQTVTGEAEKEEEVMGLHGDHGVLNQVAGDLLHLGVPHTVGHLGPGEEDLELQVVTGVAIELLENVKSEESNKLKGLCPLLRLIFLSGQTLQPCHSLLLLTFTFISSGCILDYCN